MQYTNCMQRINIENIANVIIGYTFRGAILEHKEGALYVIQARNITDQLVLTEQFLTKTKLETSHTKAFAQDGDVVISARGSFKSAVLRSSKKIIASSSVYLLRLKANSQILPEFLAISLNSSMGQKDIAQIATGAAIKLMLRKDLEEISMPVLPLSQQERVIALYQNIKQQQNLSERRNELHKNIMNAVFLQLMRS